MNEILGRSDCAPIVFGAQAPDSGNAEILAHYGTPEQRERFLEPLLCQEIVSCHSMTEPQGGADPKVSCCRAELDGHEWVISGEKWFSSHARWAEFLIVMVVTDPDSDTYDQMSMLLVPMDTAGVEIVRNIGVGVEEESLDGGSHAYIRYTDCRVPAENMLGDRGQGFVVAQTRLGGGRIHHAMRTVGCCARLLDQMCERALSRETQGELLARKQLVQDAIAKSWIQLETFRLLVLQTAWRIDRYQDSTRVRADISAVKALMPKVYLDIASWALQIHGSLGASWEMNFSRDVLESFHMGLADGPTEVHKITVARQILKGYEAGDEAFPSTHLPKLRAEAREQYRDVLARHGRFS